MSDSGLSLGGPNKVKARRKSSLFTEGSLKVENKEHWFDFVVTLYLISLSSNAQLFENVETISQICWFYQRL